MSYKDFLDPQSERFHYTWTNRKHLNAQINGQTKVSHNTIISRGNAKAHRWQ